MKPYYETETGTLYNGDALEALKAMSDGIVQTCITSPPYWGLRDYGIDGQLGLEKTPEEYVAKMVEIFREVKRVLRDDGTLWLNLGDSYASGKGTCHNPGGNTSSFNVHLKAANVHPLDRGNKSTLAAQGLKPKDLIGIPWRVAFALQADGWYLRSDIIWHKPNPMPESVTDRPTKSHEYIFLLTKSPRYFYDAESIKENSTMHPVDWNKDGTQKRESFKRGHGSHKNPDPGKEPFRAISATRNKRTVWTVEDDGLRNWLLWYSNQPEFEILYNRYADEMRNKSDVWTIATMPYKEAHFATFPPKLIEPCILAGTSEKGCCAACGAPYERVIEKGELKDDPGRKNRSVRAVQFSVDENDYIEGGTLGKVRESKTIGWQPTCQDRVETRPCTVLDPFAGAGTTLLQAEKYGRKWIGIELNLDYCSMIFKRLEPEIRQRKLF